MILCVFGAVWFVCCCFFLGGVSPVWINIEYLVLHPLMGNVVIRKFKMSSK